MKQRLMLIKTKAVKLVAYLKVQHTVYTAMMYNYTLAVHMLTHDCASECASGPYDCSPLLTR